MSASRRVFCGCRPAGSGTARNALLATGVDMVPAVARAQKLRIKNAKTTPSVCPYCSVDCATLVHTVEGKIVNIEGDPRSPHNEGTLAGTCPYGGSHAVGFGECGAMAQSVLDEWRLVQVMPAFAAWLEQGAPSADTVMQTGSVSG